MECVSMTSAEDESRSAPQAKEHQRAEVMQKEEKKVQQQPVEVVQPRVQPRVPGINVLDVEDALLTETPPALLQRVQLQGVRRMTRVQCCLGPAWKLQLLQAAAPLLEDLEMQYVAAEHLLALHSMPRLRRLDVYLYAEAVPGVPPSVLPLLPAALPPLPEGHAGLQWLRVYDMPRQTTIALLQQHSHSLRELRVWVGTGPDQNGWPFSCEDLDSLLQQCGLRALRKLELERTRHTKSECRAQLAAVRRVLPRVTVKCLAVGCSDDDCICS